MATSAYISQNLTEHQLRFLKLLDDHEILYFATQNIEQQLGVSFQNLNEILENLVHKKLLVRIEKGKFTRPQFQDVHVLASFISGGGVAAYWTALHLHNLTERFPNKVFIKTTRRKRNTQIAGTDVQFVTVNQSKMQGITRTGYGDNSYPLTDIECTLLDCFDQPRYAGDWPDLLKAFAHAKLNAGKLIAYAKKYNNMALCKRMGFLAELLQKNQLEEFIIFAKNNTGKKYSLFETGGAEKGEFRSDWMLRLNNSERDILEMIQNTY